MQPAWKYGAIPALAIAIMAGPNTPSLAVEQVCYECAAKLCYEEFTTAASAVDQQFEQERDEVERHLADMQLEVVKKAEVLGATEEVLRDNAGQRKRLAYNGLRQCLGTE